MLNIFIAHSKHSIVFSFFFFWFMWNLLKMKSRWDKNTIFYGWPEAKYIYLFSIILISTDHCAKIFHNILLQTSKGTGLQFMEKIHSLQRYDNDIYMFGTLIITNNFYLYYSIWFSQKFCNTGKYLFPFLWRKKSALNDWWD